MKRTFLTAACVGLMSTLGLVGCSDESKVSTTEKVSSPDGATTTKVTKSVDSSGSNPPANSAGETGKGAMPK